jgi:hypothetical protein
LVSGGIDGGKGAMSPKKTILKTLSEGNSESGNGAPIRPSTIPGFREAPEKYQQTINTLLKERLIEGVKDPDGHMAISLNAHRAEDVRKVLRPVWAHPAILALFAVFAAAAGYTFLV